MTAHQPLRSLITSISRPSFPTRYICRLCLAVQFQKRTLHQNIKSQPIPNPTPFVPDVSTFLTLIGRGMSAHTSKFSSWESLFKLSSPQLKELGIEPARSRRYLLRWREKFRKGEYGIGGDFRHVQDGVGELRVLEVPSLRQVNATDGKGGPEIAGISISGTPGMQKLILNTPTGATSYTELLSDGETSKDLRKPALISLKDGHMIVGSYVQPVKGSNGSTATLKVSEGLWEHKRGRKIYGGERRRAETLHKMRAEERKKNA